MSSSRRKFLQTGLLVALGGGLAACGFTPVYGPDGPGKRLFGKVRAADPKTVDDFAFVRRVTERLGPPQDVDFDLSYNLRIAIVPQAITPDEITTRYALNGSAEFTLTESATGRVVTRGQVNNFSSYSTTGTTVATMSSEQDAHDRLAFMLADQVITRLYGAVPAGTP